MNNLMKKKFLTSWLLDILFPRFCIKCKKEGLYICNECSIFTSETQPVCPLCGLASKFGKTHKSCYTPQCLDGLTSIWDYEDIIKDALHIIKYQGKFHILEELIERLISIITKNPESFSEFVTLLTDENTIITFVPIHKSKKIQRGFDQAELLADHIATLGNKKPIKLLERTKQTQSQFELNKKERLNNIKNAFSFIGKENIKKVIIVDDIWTSGATMQECCRVLKENGATKVWGFTLAKVQNVYYPKS